MKKLQKILKRFFITAFYLYFVLTSIKPAKAFIPYIYIPDSNELNKTGVNIGKTAIQILELGQNNEAIQLAELGLTLRPSDYRLWSILAESQRRSGLLKEASISIAKAKEINSGNASLWFAEATIKLQQKETKKALILLRKGLKLDPENAIGYFTLGNCYLMEKDFKASLNSFKKAIKLKPKFWEALNNQGISLFEIGNKKKAITIWRKVITIEENAEPMLALGAALNSLKPGNTESLNLAKKALSQNPNYVSSKHRQEQLWGNELEKATKKLLSRPEMVSIVEKALGNANLKN